MIYGIQSIASYAPLFIGSIITLLLGLFTSRKKFFFGILFVLFGVACDLYFAFSQSLRVPSWFFLSGHAFVITLLIPFYIKISLREHYIEKQEVLFLGVISILSVMMFENIKNAIQMYILIEIINVSIYGILLSREDRGGSIEATLKYLIANILISAVMLLGVFLIYLATKSLEFSVWRQFETSNFILHNVIFQSGALLLIISLLFKLACSPFHFWAPLLYQESPVYALQVLATLPKIAFLSLLIEFFTLVPSNVTVSCCGFVSILVGAFGIIRQSSFMRLLAYSGIFNFGIILFLPAALMKEVGLIYAAFYILLSLTPVLLLMLFFDSEKITVDSLSGLGAHYPLFGFVISILLLGMAGMPPMHIFWNKLFILYQLFLQKQYFIGTTILVLSVIVCYRYLSVIVAIFFKLQTDGEHHDFYPNIDKNRLLYLILSYFIIFMQICGTLFTSLHFFYKF